MKLLLCPLMFYRIISRFERKFRIKCKTRIKHARINHVWPVLTVFIDTTLRFAFLSREQLLIFWPNKNFMSSAVPSVPSGPPAGPTNPTTSPPGLTLYYVIGGVAGTLLVISGCVCLLWVSTPGYCPTEVTKYVWYKIVHNWWWRHWQAWCSTNYWWCSYQTHSVICFIRRHSSQRKMAVRT